MLVGHSGNHPVQYLGTLICIYLLLICLPAWCVAVFGVHTKSQLTRTLNKIYAAKNAISIFVSLLAIGVVLVNNAPYWKLLIWLSSIPYFALGTFIAFNLFQDDE